ncbi:MAG TPA: hypothetical protein VKS21_09580, partial [Spirochaetota bacterium]|nr:hypothetical protein [Spirochaetota bacterium]
MKNCIACMFLIFNLFSSFKNCGTTVFPLSRLLPDPRLNALQTASVAEANYPFTFLINPGSHLAGKQKHFSITYLKWITDIQMLAGNFLLPKDIFNFGFSFKYFNSGDIILRENLTDSGRETHKSAFNLSSSSSMKVKRVSFGLQLKYHMDFFSGDLRSLVAISTGFLYRLNKTISFGTSVKNIGLGRRAPLAVDAGAGFTLGKFPYKFNLFLSTQYNLAQAFKIKTAIEYLHEDFINLILGYTQNFDSRGRPTVSQNFSVGFGIGWKKFQLQLAILPFYNKLTASIQVSL